VKVGGNAADCPTLAAHFFRQRVVRLTHCARQLNSFFAKESASSTSVKRQSSLHWPAVEAHDCAQGKILFGLLSLRIRAARLWSALFKENGPYLIDPDTLALSLNPSSWNSNATVIWIDQPVGTGYSYADKGDLGVTSEDEMATSMIKLVHGCLHRGIGCYMTRKRSFQTQVPAVSLQRLPRLFHLRVCSSSLLD
jgi:hypothetical protein